MECPYVDMHCDSLTREIFDKRGSVYDGEGMQSLKKMSEAGQLCQFYAIFFQPPNLKDFVKDTPEIPPDWEYFQILREGLYMEVEKHKDKMAMAYSYQDIMTNWKMGLSSAMLTVEDGRGVDGQMENLYRLHDAGVRAIAPTWNFANCFGYPNFPKEEYRQKGLTDFGKEAVEEMNRLSMMVDVSHLSDGGFYDVARISRKPFIASHSDCRAVTDHPRNLTDDMIRLLAEKGGVAGINFAPDFSAENPKAGECHVKDLVRHVLHFMNTGGEDCVGIGTDFDGVWGKLEIDEPAKMDQLFHALQKAGVTERQLDKIARENVLRVIKEC